MTKTTLVIDGKDFTVTHVSDEIITVNDKPSDQMDIDSLKIVYDRLFNPKNINKDNSYTFKVGM